MNQAKPHSLRDATPESPERSKLSVNWFYVLLLLLLGIIGFVPRPVRVGGTVEIELSEGSREIVRAPRRAVIDEFYVKTGDYVYPGDELVKLTSHELDREIATVEADIFRAKELLAEAQLERLQAEADLSQTLALSEAARVRADRFYERNLQVTEGDLTPAIQSLIEEQLRLKSQLEYEEVNLQRYEDLLKHGAISLDTYEEREVIRDATRKSIDILEANIAFAKQQLSDVTTDEIGNSNYLQVSVEVAQRIANMTARIEIQEEAIGTKGKRLEHLKDQRSRLVIRAEKEGEILDHDLDLMLGRRVESDTLLLRIANLEELTGKMQIKQEEWEFFSKHLPENPEADDYSIPEVTFRSSGRGEKYSALVKGVLYDVQPDATQRQRFITVLLDIENSEQNLLPGAVGHARLQLTEEKFPIYGHLWREARKALPIWPWF